MENVNFGSGIIIEDNGLYYVLTANHCIYGDNNIYENIKKEDIWIESKQYNSFKRIEVLEVCANHNIQDWALLKIQNDGGIDFPSCLKFGHNFIIDEPIRFIGYQYCNRDECRYFEGKIISTPISENEFTITLTNETFNQGGEFGAQIAQGLSGSGVFIIRTEEVYLIGITKSVIGEIALNNDIKCSPINNISYHVKREFLDLNDPNLWKEWLISTDKQMTEKDIDNWIESSDKYFGNLMRKSKTLYFSEDKAKSITRDRILEFLEQEYRNNTIRNRGDLLSKFESTAETFEKSVKDNYSRNVETSNEAKDLLLRLEKEFADHIKELIGDKTNKYNLELARNKVTWWLMNCSFDFKE